MSRPSRGCSFAVVDPIVYTGHDFAKASEHGVKAVAPRFKHKGVCTLLEGLRAELAIYSLSATTPAAPASRPARAPSTRHGRDLRTLREQPSRHYRLSRRSGLASWMTLT